MIVNFPQILEITSGFTLEGTRKEREDIIMSDVKELEMPVVEGQVEEAVDTAEEITTPTNTSGMDLMSMVKNIDEIGNAMEMQRQLVDARGRLKELCLLMEIGEDDMEFLHNNMSNRKYADSELKFLLKDLDSINANFFTREDGTIIKVKNVQASLGESEFTVKRDLVTYLVSFYSMEQDVLKDINEINQEIKDFYSEDISSMCAQVANSLKSSIKTRREEAYALEDGDAKSKRLKLLSVMENAYTFQALLDVIERHPSIVANTIMDIGKPENVKETGARYQKKLQQGRVASTLYSTINDDVNKSLEKQFLCQDDYVEGYENLFAFCLIRFFSREDWSSKTAYTKEMHNATVIVLTSMLSGNLNHEFRDEVATNIAKVWKRFKDYLTK